MTLLAWFAGCAAGAGGSFELEVFPPESKRMTDPRTGAELLFVTTAEAKDANLYFHEYSWLEDESVLLFTSSRPNGGLMGYLATSGELIRIHSPKGPLGGATAAARGNAILATRGREIVEIKLRIRPGRTPQDWSTVSAEERVLCEIPDGSPSTALNPSCDGRYVAFGATGFRDAKRGPAILMVDLKSGKLKEVCRLPEPPGYGGHVQWSRTNPRLISFAGGRGASKDVSGGSQIRLSAENYAASDQRLWVVDVREGVPRNVYQAEEGELVTHESWWADDQILFCGGKSTNAAVLSHVKVLNIYTGVVRIAGAGAWWPEASAAEAARLNWWHVAGTTDGRWIAADNWHGDVMLFEGKTTRPRLLTAGHRTYGGGDHPHVGWDRKGEKVVFASHMLGNENVCVARIPAAWQQAVAANVDGLAKRPR